MQKNISSRIVNVGIGVFFFANFFCFPPYIDASTKISLVCNNISLQSCVAAYTDRSGISVEMNSEASSTPVQVVVDNVDPSVCLLDILEAAAIKNFSIVYNQDGTHVKIFSFNGLVDNSKGLEIANPVIPVVSPEVGDKTAAQSPSGLPLRKELEALVERNEKIPPINQDTIIQFPEAGQMTARELEGAEERAQLNPLPSTQKITLPSGEVLDQAELKQRQSAADATIDQTAQIVVGGETFTLQELREKQELADKPLQPVDKVTFPDGSSYTPAQLKALASPQ